MKAVYKIKQQWISTFLVTRNNNDNKRGAECDRKPPDLKTD